MTVRGQITIPAEIRDRLSLSAGHRLDFFLQNEQIIMIPINRSIKGLKGALAKPAKSLTCEEMNEAIRSVRE
jgi:AbrB family looped-hinge helix DNA binding protein